jgi:hypothetical protein
MQPPVDESTRPSGGLNNDDINGGADGDGTAPRPDDSKGIPIVDKVAMISDTQYKNRLFPLIMHYHVLHGPDWPIVFFTSTEVAVQMQPAASSFLSSSSPAGSAIWRRAVDSGAVLIRYIPSQYDLSN